MHFVPPLILSTLKKFGAPLRFLISGGTAALVLLGVLSALTEVLEVWYLASSVIAFCCAFVTSFTLHKFWTFNDPHLQRVPLQASAHLVVGLINLGVNTALLYMFVEYFHVHYLVSQILISGGIAVVSYFVYKHVIFRKGSAGAAPDLL